MKRFMLAVALALAVMPVISRGDAMDEAEAKQRGVTVEAVQLERAKARIAELQKLVSANAVKIAELEKTLKVTLEKEKAAEDQLAAIKAATPPVEAKQADAVQTALKNGDLCIGMTLDQIKTLTKADFYLMSETGNMKTYKFFVSMRAVEGNAKRFGYKIIGTFSDGKLSSYDREPMN